MLRLNLKAQQSKIIFLPLILKSVTALTTQLTRKQPADFIVFFSQKLRITFECGLFSSADFIFFSPKNCGLQ